MQYNIVKRTAFDYSGSPATQELIEATNAQLGPLPFGIETLESIAARAKLFPALGKYALYELYDYAATDGELEFDPLIAVFDTFCEGDRVDILKVDAQELIQSLLDYFNIDVVPVGDTGYTEVAKELDLPTTIEPGELPDPYRFPRGFVKQILDDAQKSEPLSLSNYNNASLPGRLLIWIAAHLFYLKGERQRYFHDGVMTVQDSYDLMLVLPTQFSEHGLLLQRIVELSTAAGEQPSLLKHLRLPYRSPEDLLDFTNDVVAFGERTEAKPELIVSLAPVVSKIFTESGSKDLESWHLLLLLGLCVARGQVELMQMLYPKPTLHLSTLVKGIATSEGWLEVAKLYLRDNLDVYIERYCQGDDAQAIKTGLRALAAECQ